MIKIAMLSFWHVHAPDYAKQVENHPDTKIVAVWDEDKKRGEKEAEKYKADFYESLDDLLAQADIDAVIVDTPTTMHREVIVKSAQAGKHIFTEKVIAATMKEANEIVAAVKQAGVKLTVSLPRINDSYTLAIQQILNDRLLGDITLVRTRLSHNGATAGWLPEHFYRLQDTAGGALIDLGCHPMYLARLFLGRLPESVYAQYGYLTGKEVEDNAAAVLYCDNGAMAVVEAGFVNKFSPFSIEVHGTDGSLMYGTPEPKLLVRAVKPGENEADWQEYELPAQHPSAFDQWVGHIQNGTTADDNIQLALDLTRLMEASNLSAEKKQSVRLDDLQK